MFNLNSVVVAFNLVNVSAGAYKDKDGFVLTYRPVQDKKYGANTSSVSFVDAEDLFYSLIEWNGINIKPTLNKSIVDLKARLDAVSEDSKEYTLEQLQDFVTKYEDKYSSCKYDEVVFYAKVRKDISAEFSRLGADIVSLNMLGGIVNELVDYREMYNS